MPRYLIEREVPGAGALSAEELKGLAKQSNTVLTTMAGRATWIESFVTQDAITCVYEADNADVVREHGAAGGFPVNGIREIAAIIDPSSAD